MSYEVVLLVEQHNHVFQNASLGQTTLLDMSGSKFCLEPLARNPDISRMTQSPINDLRTPNMLSWPECQSFLR